MALEITNIQVPIGSGVDEKMDQRLLPQGKVTSLTNGVYDKLGTITKRKGYETLSTGSISGSIQTSPILPIPVFEKLGTFEDQLIGIDGRNGFVYSKANSPDVWSQVDRVSTATVERNSVFQAIDDIANASMVVCNGRCVYTWTGNVSSVDIGGPKIATGNIYVLVTDEKTGTVLFPKTSVSAGHGFGATVSFFSAIPVISDTNRVSIVFAYIGAAANGIYVVNIELPTNNKPYIGASALATSGGANMPTGTWLQFDVCADPSTKYLYIVFPRGTPYIDIVTLYSDTLGQVVGTTSYTTTSTFPLFSVACCLASNGTQKYLDISYANQSVTYLNEIRIMRYKAVPASPGNLGTTLAFVSGPYFFYTNKPSTATVVSINGPKFMGMVSSGINMTYVTFTTYQYNSGCLLASPTSWCHPIYMTGSLSATPTSLPSIFPARSTPWTQLLTKPFIVNSTNGVATSHDQTGSCNVCVMGNLQQYFSSGITSQSLQGSFYLFDTMAGGNSQFVSGTFRPLTTIAPRLANAPPSGSPQDNNFISVVSLSSLYTNKYKTVGITTTSNESSGRGGIEEVDIDISPLSKYEIVEVGKNVHISTGVPTYYDGVNTGEIGFLYFPDMGINSIQYQASTGTALGRMNPGVYQYQVCYEWIDAKGQRHQSAPSIQRAVTVPGAANAGSVTLFIPTLGIQARQPQVLTGSNAVAAVVYRSEADRTILYRLTPETATPGLLNDTTTSFMTFVDNSNDSAVTSGGTVLSALNVRSPIYTTGGVLPNYCPPSAKYMCSHMNRVWLAGTDNPKQVWYSKQAVQGEAIAFNDDLSFMVDDGGDITGIEGLDDKIIIFKKDRIFFVSGEGPNALGTQNDFSAAIPYPSDVGCINSNSIVLTPDGIMFQSSIGIMLLTRGNEVINVGYPITDHLTANPTITSAVVHPYQSQVRFTCGNVATTAPYASTGITLVYDYLAKAWSVFEILDSVNSLSSSLASSAVVQNNNYKFASSYGLYGSSSVGAVFSENDTQADYSYCDSREFVPMTIESSWVAVNDIQGFQRVKRVAVLGQANSPSKLTVSLANDYSDTYIQSASFNYATPTQVSQNELHVGRQKCEAIRVKVQDTYLSGSTIGTGQGTTLTRVTLRAGVKTGTQKLNPGSRA